MKKAILILVVLVIFSASLFAGGVKENIDFIFHQNNLPNGTEQQFDEYEPDTENLFSSMVTTVDKMGMEFVVKKINEAKDEITFIDMYAQVMVTTDNSFFVRFSINNLFPNYALFVVVPELEKYYYGEGTTVENFKIIYSGIDSDEWKTVPVDNTRSTLGNLLEIVKAQQIVYDRAFAAKRIDLLAKYKVEKY